MREEKTGRKISGFFKALLLAIISFFVIFLFFSDASEKFFGTSVKNPKKVGEAVQKGVENAADKVSDATDKVVDTVTDVVSDKIVNSIISK